MTATRSYQFPQAVDGVVDADGQAFTVPAGTHAVAFGTEVAVCEIRCGDQARRIARETLLALCKAGQALAVFADYPADPTVVKTGG